MIKSANFVCLNGNSDEPSHLHLELGQTFLHAPSASFFRQDRNGQAQLNLPYISAVRTAPGARVARRGVGLSELGITRSVTFAVGGEYRATFAPSGELLTLEGAGLSITKAADALIVGPWRQSDLPSL
jgi:hypothetical protein